MTHQEDALQEIVAIARRHNIPPADIARALGGPAGQTARTMAGNFSRLMTYIGGIFVVAGIGVFISMFWGDMGSFARVLVTLGTGFLLFVMGVASLYEPKYERAAMPLFVTSSVLQPGGIFVMLSEYSKGGDWHYGVLFMSVFMLIQQGAVFWAKRHTALAFTLIYFGAAFFWTLFDLIGLPHTLATMVTSISILCVCYAATKSRHARITPFWYFIATAGLLYAFFDAVDRTPLEIFFVGLCGVMIYLSTHIRSSAMLFVSAISLFGYIGYFTAEHFAGVLGWPIALIILGLGLIGFSSYVVKLNNKYIKQQ